jgi:DNA-binding transcriptional MerR regulator
MTLRNTQGRRDYLVREWGNLNDSMVELRRTMTARQDQKADVVRALQATGMSIAEIGIALDISRQEVHRVLRESEKRYAAGPADDFDPSPRRFLVQHQDLGPSRMNGNWTAYFHTLEDAERQADRVLLRADDPNQVRQQIVDTVSGEWRFRNVGDQGWSPPTVARVPDVVMDGLLSMGEQGRRQPEHQGGWIG